MKKNILRILSLTLCMMMLIPMLTVTAAEGDASTPINVYKWENRFYEDHVGDTIETLTAGNDTTNKLGSKTPIYNMYDLSIVGEGYTPFADFKPASKNLLLQGNHSSETTSKNVFLMDNNNNKVAGKGMYTVIPESAMKDLNEFTISWITRVHDPKSGYAGLALFYDNMVTEGGIEYFGGYDNYTFVGYTGSRSSASWSAHSIYGGQRVNFATEALQTKFAAKNNSVYASIRCTKGDYEYNGVKYTAKIESYSDDQHVATSYAQWVEAPVMFYYENPSSRWSVQFTNLKLDGKVPQQDTAENMIATTAPMSILGTSVRYIGDAGLRFYTKLEKESLYEHATAVETGVIMLEADKYTGELTVDTTHILSGAARVQEDAEEFKTEIVEFTDAAAIKDKAFVARAYVKYTISGKDFYSYSPVEKASCARTATKVLGKYADSTNKSMLDACKTMSGNNATVTMMSFNMLVAGHGSEQKVQLYGGIDLPYNVRLESAVNMIKDVLPDIVGTQETNTLLQKNNLMANEFVAANYACFGSDDDNKVTGGTGSGEEGLYILYKKDRFDLVSSGVKYLSSTPDVPHSYIKEAAEYNAVPENIAKFYPRKMIWVVLKDKATGQLMAFADTHLAYTASDTELDEFVRVQQAQIAVELLSGGTLFDKSIPYAVVGDLNAKPNTGSYNVFLDVMDDLRYNADKTAPATQGTYHVYNNGSTFIDHMFVSRDSLYNHEYKVITKEYFSETLNRNILPSDHYAIMGTVTILPD